jgi:hypothetical protein
MQGACYTSHPQGRLQVRVSDRRMISGYRFGTEQAEVLFCTVCGVSPLIKAELGRQYAVLNANCIHGLSIERAKLPPPLELAEQSTDERVARWKKAWIPHVEIKYLEKVNAALL